MKKRHISMETISSFGKWLQQEEKSEATIEKYVRDVRAFSGFAQGEEIHKELMVE